MRTNRRRDMATAAAAVAVALALGGCAAAQGDDGRVSAVRATVAADPARAKSAPPAPSERRAAPSAAPATTTATPASPPPPTRSLTRPPAPAATKATARNPSPSPTPDRCATTYDGPPFYTSAPTEGGDGSNGKLPPSALTAVPWAVDSHGTGFYLRTAAERALVRLDKAFVARFGHHLDVDLAYRDYATQVAMRAALGTVAAVPGTSKHGTGLAIDVPEWPCEYGWGTPQRTWLVAHGPSYGWVTPWRTKSADAEYWHFEYAG